MSRGTSPTEPGAPMALGPSDTEQGHKRTLDSSDVIGEKKFKMDGQTAEIGVAKKEESHYEGWLYYNHAKPQRQRYVGDAFYAVKKKNRAEVNLKTLNDAERGEFANACTQAPTMIASPFFTS